MCDSDELTQACLTEVLIWTSQPSRGKMTVVVSVGWRSFKSSSCLVHTRSEGRKEAVEEEKDHIFTAVRTGCHGVKKYQYLCKGNGITADK